MRRRILLSCLAAALLLAVPGCAPKYTSAALGRYEEYRPFARLDGRAISLDLARGGYVAVVSVVPPNPSLPDRPILFEAVYPYFETDERRFPAGTHRLIARRASMRDPMYCGMEEVPTITGCRRRLEMLPGVRTLSEYNRSYSIRGGHYIVVVSDEPVDPFTLAEDLFYVAFDRPDLTSRLRQLDAPLAAGQLERALLDRPGTPDWAALYVAAR